VIAEERDRQATQVILAHLELLDLLDLPELLELLEPLELPELLGLPELPIKIEGTMVSSRRRIRG